MPKSHVLPFNPAEFQADILSWYDKHQRVLPWRARGNSKPDPYHVWLSEIMLQQTTVPAVIPYFLKFTERWPDVTALAMAKDEEVMSAWAGLGYYARARNLLKCARVMAHDCGGKFPETIDALKSLPGIGDYTAAAIVAIAFGQQATVVDGNIERIVARVFAVDTPLPNGKKDIRAKADLFFKAITEKGKKSVRQFPQALMDIGADICSPKSPKCSVCPVSKFCKAYHQKKVEFYPVKPPKKSVPVRKGFVYWVRTPSGKVMMETRDSNRMLGGMKGIPTTDWDKTKEFDEKHLQVFAKMRGLEKIGSVYHVFTHFRLELAVWAVTIPDEKNMVGLSHSFWRVEADMDGLPTVFLKVAKLANHVFKGVVR
jgi:A/G-specific adenine glycosylase